MLNLIKAGVTTILVSHNLQVVQEICTRALWLDHGVVIAEGEPESVVGNYRREVLRMV